MLAATYAKRPGHWCAGSPSQLHHEAQQRHKGVGLSACELGLSEAKHCLVSATHSL